jgi:hypothetical protein
VTIGAAAPKAGVLAWHETDTDMYVMVCNTK